MSNICSRCGKYTQDWLCVFESDRCRCRAIQPPSAAPSKCCECSGEIAALQVQIAALWEVVNELRTQLQNASSSDSP